MGRMWPQIQGHVMSGQIGQTSAEHATFQLTLIGVGACTHRVMVAMELSGQGREAATENPCFRGKPLRVKSQ